MKQAFAKILILASLLESMQTTRATQLTAKTAAEMELHAEKQLLIELMAESTTECNANDSCYGKSGECCAKDPECFEFLGEACYCA